MNVVFLDFDFFDKKNIHFGSTIQPFQFLFRMNYSFDGYILSMHYNLFLTYFIFFLNFGLGVKTRFSFPFYKFNRWFPSKLHTNKLMFWLNFKFLVFDSYFPFFVKFNKIFNQNFNVVGYFPFSFYFTVFEQFFGFYNRFSFISNHINEVRFRFFRRRYESFFDIDLHVSLYLGRGNKRIKVVGVINFFRYMLQEYFFIHGLEQSVVSLVKSANEPSKMISTFSFFKKRFLFDFFFNLRRNFISNLFLYFYFNEFFFKNFVVFFFKFFFNYFFKFLKLYYFFKFVFFFLFIFLNKYMLKKNFRFFFFFKFFFFEFLFKFFLTKRIYLNFSFFFFKFVRFLLKVFLFKFFIFRKINTFIFFFFNYNVNLKKMSLNNKLFFNSVVFFRFKSFWLLRKKNPFNSVRYSGFFKFVGFNRSFFTRNKFLYFRRFPSFIFFSFLIFLRLFFFLFFYIYKKNFIGIFGFYNFYILRIYFFKLFYFSIFWYNRFLLK